MKHPANTARVLVWLALLCALPPRRLAGADVVHLKKGEKTMECLVISEQCRICLGQGRISCPTCGGKGKITRETVCPRCEGHGRVVCPACDGLGYFGEEITVRLHGGIILRIPLSEIEKVERGGGSEVDFMTPAQAYKKLLKELDRDDPKAQFELGNWCLERNMPEEAELHYYQALRLDESYRERITPRLEKIREEREARVEALFRKALKQIVQASYPEALEGLKRLAGSYQGSGLMRTPSLQERVVREVLGVDAARWGFSARELIASLERRQALLCTECGGSGRVDCTLCNGTGDAICKRCSGSGWTVCPDCNGTARAVCPTCFGHGRVERRLGFGPEITIVCPTCDGKGSVPCRRCRGRGRLRCPDCSGRGRVKGGCPLCDGSTKIVCPTCKGKGLKPPTGYRWGPYRVFPALAKGEKPKPGTVFAFQARYHGALVTVVPEQAAYGGRLAAFLERTLGGGNGYLLLCVDNRGGAEAIRLGEKGRFLRLVSPGHVQVEMISPFEIRRRLEEAGSDRRLLEVVTPGDVMPDAIRNVLCVFHEALTSGLGYRAFFGDQDITEMDGVSAPADEALAGEDLQQRAAPATGGR